jgi:hypothetical protein
MSRSALAALFAAALLAGCARRGPPSGGPPDLVPPRVESSRPDSGSARVPLTGPLAITFTKTMEPRSTGDAIAIAPRVDIRQKRWSGRSVTLALSDPLKPRQTYTLFVGTGARDHHGNALDNGAAITFSTADSFPPGVIEGEIQALGFAGPGTYLWVYGGGRAPDSTARDFDALGLTDAQSRFRITGLPVPGSYRLWGFADLNRNRSFEPQTDVLAPADTTIQLLPSAPAARGLVLHMTNPRAPGRVRGTVIDSTGDTLGVVRVFAISTLDTTRRILVDADDRGAFEFKLAAGPWRLFAFRDDDRNRAWRMDVEPASEFVPVDVPAAGDVADLVLRLRRRPVGN